MRRKLKRDFYNRPTLEVVKELLGKYLVVKLDGNYLSGKIVETEAYAGEKDPGSHAYKGKTARNEVMFGEPGHCYIYFTYGMHHCLNFVTEKKGVAGACLIRAVEPKEGIELMQKRRKSLELENLCSGPAKICQALGLSKKQNGWDLCASEIYVEDRGEKVGKIVSSNRIGVENKNKWRFFIGDSEFVSKK
jgi:DNA-3-methyladenine glycosylase